MGNWVINFLLDKKRLVFDNKNTVEKKKIFFLLLGAFIFLLLPSVVFGQVVINEVYYQGDSTKEWVEIYNYGDASFNLMNCRLEDNNGSDNIGAYSINAKEFLVIAKIGNNSLAEAVGSPGKIIWLDGPIGNGLADGGDRLLLSCGGEEIDKISWGSDIIYFNIKAVGNGYSLERLPTGQGDFVEQKNPTPGKGVFIAFTPIPTATISPSPQLTSDLTPTVIVTPAPAAVKATYQINEVKNEKGEVLSSVKIYVDDQYLHHYAPEVLEFGDGYYCDDDKKVACGFGEHSIRLEKNGYEDWEETKEIKAGDAYSVNPVMAFLPSPTPNPTATPVSSLSPTGRISPSPSLAITSLLLSPTSSSPLLPFADFALVPKKITGEEEILEENLGQVLGEEKREEKKSSSWYFGVGAFYLGVSGWRLARKNDNDIMEKLNFEEK